MELVAKDKILEVFRKIKEESSNSLQGYSGKIAYCQEILELYQQELRNYVFPNPESEIHFFKEVKQIPQAYHIYYCTLLEFEFEYGRASELVLEEAILAKMRKINSFIRTHLAFVKYIELNQTHLDHQYFTRQTSYHDFHSAQPYYRDPKFSTSHDLLLSEIIACGYLITFLQSRLRNKTTGNSLGRDGAKGLQWTAPNVDLVELGYALHTTGAINHGNISLKKFMESLGEFLRVDLADHKHAFLRLRQRKKPYKFLDKLKRSLDQRSADLDD